MITAKFAVNDSNLNYLLCEVAMKTLVSLPKCTPAFVGLIFLCFGSNAFAQDIYSEDFNGVSGAEGSLNGTTEDTQGEVWIANGFATANGELATGQFEGSALLPFDPVVGSIYTLSVDVTTGSDRWFGIGFSNEGSTGMLNVPQTDLPRMAVSVGSSYGHRPPISSKL